MMATPEKTQMIIEAALMVAGHPLTIAALQNLFSEEERPIAADIKTYLAAIKLRFQDTGIELQEVATGYRFQAKAELSPWLSRLWEERSPRYSRAFLETLAIIAYKQPITRAEIEEIRGVTVSSHIVKTLQEREWIRIIGYREVPGRPALYGTTKDFLDHFNVKTLNELPTLAEFKDLAAQDVQVQLALENSNIGPDNSEVIPEEREAIVTENEDNLVDIQDTTELVDQPEPVNEEELAVG
jgi:segregation and condensation protein B